METIDPGKIARVWERVHPESERKPDASGLSELIAQQLTAAMTYDQLSRQLRGNAAHILRRLQEEKRAQAASLKGIYRLMTDRMPIIKVPPIPQRNPETALRHCCRQELQCLIHYEQLCEDPIKAQLFPQLKKRQQAQYCLVLELFGNIAHKLQG